MHERVRPRSRLRREGERESPKPAQGRKLERERELEDRFIVISLCFEVGQVQQYFYLSNIYVSCDNPMLIFVSWSSKYR